MAGDDVEVITLDSSEDEGKSTETPPILSGKLLFTQFVETCSPLIADKKKRAAMVGLLQKRFSEAKAAFQESEELANILTSHISELSTKKKDAFVHILDIVNVLKSAASGDSKRKSKHSKREELKTHDHEQKREKNIDIKVNSDHEQKQETKIDIKINTCDHEQQEKNIDVKTNTSDHEQNQGEKIDIKINTRDHEQKREKDIDVKTNTSDHEQKKQKKNRDKISISDDDIFSKQILSQEGTSDSECESSLVMSDSGAPLREDQLKKADDKLLLESNEIKYPEKTLDSKIEVIECEPNTAVDVSQEGLSVVEHLPPSNDQTSEQKQSTNVDTNMENNSGHCQNAADTENRFQKRKKRNSHRQIRKYERLLHKLSVEIKRLSEKELSLEEMEREDSTHILEYQLRKRIMKVYEKLCELKEIESNTGRVGQRRIKFHGTRYPEINKKLEKLANLPDYFPDFQDVFIIITKVNDRKGLGLERRRIHNIAKDSFEMIGKKLQQRRQEDFLANFSSHPTLDFVEARDPAEVDIELQMKLKNNTTLGSQKLNEITRTYEERQTTNELMGVNMEVASQNSESDQSDVQSDEEAPRKKKRRVNLITVVNDDEDEDFATDGESHTATEDDTADEATGSAQEADDEDDEVSDDVVDIDDDDDGASDFGALSPLSTDEEEEINSDDGNSVEEVHSPQKDKAPETNQCEIKDSCQLSADAASNQDVSSADESSVDEFNTNISTANSFSSNHLEPQTVSSNTGLNGHVKNSTGKPTSVQNTRLADVSSRNRTSDQSGCVAVDSTNSPESASSSVAAVKVVDSSSSLPIILNIMSLRHEVKKQTDSIQLQTAPGPGRVSPVPSPGSVAVQEHTGVLAKGLSEVTQKTLPPEELSLLSGTAVQELSLKKPSPLLTAEKPSHSPCSSPQVSSSRSLSRTWRRRLSSSPEEITLLSSDSDSDILLSGDDANTGTLSSVRDIPPVQSDQRTDTNRDPLSRLHHTTPSVGEHTWRPSVTNTSTPRGKFFGVQSVCLQHRHFGPPSSLRRRTRESGEQEIFTLSDSD